jgi:hypothetical protein
VVVLLNVQLDSALGKSDRSGAHQLVETEPELARIQLAEHIADLGAEAPVDGIRRHVFARGLLALVECQMNCSAENVQAVFVDEIVRLLRPGGREFDSQDQMGADVVNVSHAQQE